MASSVREGGATVQGDPAPVQESMRDATVDS